MTMFASQWFASAESNPISLDATASVGQLGGSNVDRINDGLDTPVFSTASRPLGGDKVIAKLDFGSPQLIAGFRAVNVRQASVTDAVSMRIEHSADDATYTTFGTSWNISPGNSYMTETQTPTAVTKRYWQITANQNYDDVAEVGEMALYAATGLMP